MNQNKNRLLEVGSSFTQNQFDLNVFRNDRPQRRSRPGDEHSTNLITHLLHQHQHHSTLLPNPEKHKAQLSYSKIVPLNNEVLR